MIDISGIGDDIRLFDTQTSKSANILSVQVGSLEYAPDLGIDLDYFLSEDFSFQNESFKAYLIEALAYQGVNVSSVVDLVENLLTNYIINVSPNETSTGLMSR